MDYIGHFSFKQNNGEEYGYFDLFVSALDFAEALNKFTDEIHWIKKYGIDDDKIFENTKSIILENLIQIENTPHRPAVIRWEKYLKKKFICKTWLLSSDQNLSSIKVIRNDEEESDSNPLFMEFEE